MMGLQQSQILKQFQMISEELSKANVETINTPNFMRSLEMAKNPVATNE